LRGMPAEVRARSDVDMQTTERLDRVLSPIAPTGMLEAVRSLAADDRRALARCLLFCTAYAKGETETVLGAPENLVRELANELAGMAGD
jgi:hypothetical protein